MSASDPPRSFTELLLESLPATLVESGVVVAVIAFMVFLLGESIEPRTAAFIFLGLVILSLIGESIGQFSAVFFISIVGVLAIIGLFIPPGFVAPFDPIFGFFESIIGVQLAGLQLVSVAVFSGLAILTIIIIRLRVTSAFKTRDNRPLAANPSTVASKARPQLNRLVRQWRDVLVAAAGLIVVSTAIFLGAFGQILGEVSGQLAQAPSFVAGVLSSFIAFLSLGGEVPILAGIDVPTFTANEYAVIAAVVLVTGAAIAIRQEEQS